MRIDANTEAVSKSSNLLDSSKKAQDIFSKKKMREVKLHQKCKELEAIFLTQLFKAMEKTIPNNSPVGSKNTLASMMFSSVMGDALANHGGIGLADIFYESVKDRDEFPKLDELKANNFIDNIGVFKLLNGSENE